MESGFEGVPGIGGAAPGKQPARLKARTALSKTGSISLVVDVGGCLAAKASPRASFRRRAKVTASKSCTLRVSGRSGVLNKRIDDLVVARGPLVVSPLTPQPREHQQLIRPASPRRPHPSWTTVCKHAFSSVKPNRAAWSWTSLNVPGTFPASSGSSLMSSSDDSATSGGVRPAVVELVLVVEQLSCLGREDGARWRGG